ncbi:MAG: MATE family efflux transporter [Puniceicoccales bacterium]|nr:MATE family efflux transporter [Puniceicoccales bacterium]
MKFSWVSASAKGPVGLFYFLVKEVFPELRKTVRLAFPIALGQCGVGLLFVIDTAMAGRLGEIAIAAAGFSGMLVVLPFLFGLGLCVGVAVLTAQGRGAGRPEHGATALRHGLVVAGVYGVVSGALIHVCVRAGALACFGQAEGVVEMAEDFAILMGWSSLPALLFQCLKNNREAIGRPWAALCWMSAGVVINVVLNFVFMFGWLGGPKMGLAGAGLATLVARSVTLVGLAVHPGGQMPRWRDGFQCKWLMDILKLGIPSAFQWTFETGVFAVAVVLIGRFGKEQQAAHQVAVSLANLAFMIPVGVSQAASIRVGEAFGARSIEAMRRIVAGVLLFAVVFMGSYALVVSTFRGRVVRLFLTGETSAMTAGFAENFVLIVAAFALFDGLQVVASGALRGMSDVRFTSISAFVCYWIISLPVGAFLAFQVGMEGIGIWVGLACAIFAAAFVLNVRLWWKLGRGRVF